MDDRFAGFIRAGITFHLASERMLSGCELRCESFLLARRPARPGCNPDSQVRSADAFLEHQDLRRALFIAWPRGLRAVGQPPMRLAGGVSFAAPARRQDQARLRPGTGEPLL